MIIDQKNPDRSGEAGQQGFALLLAVLVLLVMSSMAAIMMNNVLSLKSMGGHQKTGGNALNCAQAGIAEAMARLGNGDINLGTNPRATALIFNAASGSLPTVGTDTTAFATGQPAGAYLNYSTANKTPYALTVNFKTDAGRTVIYNYDATKFPQMQTTTGSPVYTITSTGRSGTDVVKLVAEVTRLGSGTITPNINGAMMCNVPVGYYATGTTYVCGFNHRSDTPTLKGINGRSGAGGCNENPGANQWEKATGAVAGLWSTGTATAKSPYTSGSPSAAGSQTPFFAGPWEALNMSSVQFWTWVGARNATMPVVPHGIVYVDNNTIKQDRTGSFTLGAGDGEGFLYVDGNLTIGKNFHYKGLIYVEGNVTLDDGTWILGGMVVRGTTTHSLDNQPCILYSADAITTNAGPGPVGSGKLSLISWRQI